MENSKKKNPIFQANVTGTYTDNVLYMFFCKSVSILASIAIPIVNRLKAGKASGNNAKILVACLWIVNHMALKLEGICSISSSACDNKLCALRAKIINCICYHCYAITQQKRHNGLREHNILNGIILRNVLLPVESLKALKIIFPYLRIESFGDTANETQARNYLRIIKAFPNKRCAIWSKNIAIWEKAITKEGKPENCTFVASSPIVNKPMIIDRKRYWFIDHVFTVYTKQYAKEHNIIINCGGRKCMECIKQKKNCYYRNTDYYINELLK